MSALLSPCGLHRYSLTREWWQANTSPGRVLFVMLNPSTADASVDDPTIRKCRGFASRLNYCELEVVNLFSFRATKPKDLWASDERNTPESEDHICAAVDRASLIIAAWGEQPKAAARARIVSRLIRVRLGDIGRRDESLHCLGPLTSGGHPRHPLMLAYAASLDAWPGYP